MARGGEGGIFLPSGGACAIRRHDDAAERDAGGIIGCPMGAVKVEMAALRGPKVVRLFTLVEIADQQMKAVPARPFRRA